MRRFSALLLVVPLAACGSSTRTVTRTVIRTATHRARTHTTAARPASSGATTTALTGACVAADLTLSYLGQQGAAGHGEIAFALKNTSTTPCHTYGYPGIQFLDQTGAALKTVPQRTTLDYFGKAPATTLTLGPGTTVSFRLGVTHGQIPGSVCSTAHGLQVIPPDDTATLRASIPSGAYECQDATVTPLQPGTSAYR